VVLTGAAGRIGRAIAPRLPDEWDVTLTDLDDGTSIVALDVQDLPACRAAFSGADAVVHLAANPDPAAPWAELLPGNVVGAYNVAQAAVDSGVRRLVMASSLHAVSALLDHTQVRPDDQPWPGNLYGATKAWAEALCGWVAATSTTSAIALRIGYFNSEHPDHATASARELSAWLSARDAAELVRAAVEAPDVRFLVANGISMNRYRAADLSRTMELLGYQPEDDAWAQP
jgi:nucleoside-diphosphate-sugar epimerase